MKFKLSTLTQILTNFIIRRPRICNENFCNLDFSSDLFLHIQERPMESKTMTGKNEMTMRGTGQPEKENMERGRLHSLRLLVTDQSA